MKKLFIFIFPLCVLSAAFGAATPIESLFPVNFSTESHVNQDLEEDFSSYSGYVHDIEVNNLENKQIEIIEDSIELARK
ncbi:MAG: hypothetical protein H6621_00935 [Halobacteriovoraceae bacterium]|nr:hypothetical protein [Halobacteriovoraceae bacterium]MCB9093606.1 hypothetical protein [Halobacteriovoraceae bacterium]